MQTSIHTHIYTATLIGHFSLYITRWCTDWNHVITHKFFCFDLVSPVSVDHCVFLYLNQHWSCTWRENWVFLLYDYMATHTNSILAATPQMHGYFTISVMSIAYTYTNFAARERMQQRTFVHRVVTQHDASQVLQNRANVRNFHVIPTHHVNTNVLCAFFSLVQFQGRVTVHCINW